jgi:hypothetical protein
MASPLHLQLWVAEFGTGFYPLGNRPWKQAPDFVLEPSATTHHDETWSICRTKLSGGSSEQAVVSGKDLYVCEINSSFGLLYFHPWSGPETQLVNYWHCADLYSWDSGTNYQLSISQRTFLTTHHPMSGNRAINRSVLTDRALELPLQHAETCIPERQTYVLACITVSCSMGLSALLQLCMSLLLLDATMTMLSISLCGQRTAWYYPTSSSSIAWFKMSFAGKDKTALKFSAGFVKRNIGHILMVPILLSTCIRSLWNSSSVRGK